MSKVCTLDIVNGYVINQIRLEAGYKKQGELGEKFGISHAAIGKMERGEPAISLEFLTILAEMIGTKASRIVAVIEDIADYLLEHDVAFINQTTFNILSEMIKDDKEEQEKLIVPANVEDNISLELKKAVRNLVSKKPDMDVTPIQQEFSTNLGAASLNFNSPGTTGMAIGVAAATLINPLLGIGVGASLLASKIMKNKKAP